jgi:hypothetical protein
MNGSWWEQIHGSNGWLDVGAGSAITPVSTMHHPHHPHHQMSNYNDYSSLTHSLAASNPHILTSGQHLLQVKTLLLNNCFYFFMPIKDYPNIIHAVLFVRCMRIVIKIFALFLTGYLQVNAAKPGRRLKCNISFWLRSSISTTGLFIFP